MKKESLSCTGNPQGFDPTSVGTRQYRIPTKMKILRVFIPTLTIPIIFISASEAEVSPKTQTSESQAKQYVEAMNKAQQAYYSQNTGFTSSIANLAVGIKADSAKYKYSISTGNKAVFNYGISRDANLKSFVGGVFLMGNTTKTILCQTVTAIQSKPPNPTNSNGQLLCAAGTAVISK